jgi:hypothetical protein
VARGPLDAWLAARPEDFTAWFGAAWSTLELVP